MNPIAADAYGDAYANAYGAGAFVLAQEPCDDGTDAGNGGVGALEDCPAQIYDDLHSLHILPCSEADSVANWEQKRAPHSL
mmetsp:Transcript_52092/g.86848  ORF Transcript_52092/g.86848 Transcript_52092/m.86848 type:complete len:81 (-) Transcript_52092:2389-2631(-)